MRSVVGSLIFLFGVFGNITGFYKTFPLAGFITMTAGSA